MGQASLYVLRWHVERSIGEGKVRGKIGMELRPIFTNHALNIVGFVIGFFL